MEDGRLVGEKREVRVSSRRVTVNVTILTVNASWTNFAEF